MNKPGGEWLSVRQCSERLGVSVWTIRRAIKRGHLLAHKGPKLLRIHSREWHLYLLEHWPEQVARSEEDTCNDCSQKARKAKVLKHNGENGLG